MVFVGIGKLNSYTKKIILKQQKGGAETKLKMLSGLNPPIWAGRVRGKYFGFKYPDLYKEKQMDGILFLVFWLGCASLHTVFDIKVRPVLRAVREESDFS